MASPVISIQTNGVRFACPACRATSGIYAGTARWIELDLPSTCRKCGARSRLNGLPRYLGGTVALMAAVVVFYFKVFIRSWAESPMLALLALAVVLCAAMWLHGHFVRPLAKWELAPAPPPAPREETPGLDTPLGVALRRDWVYLVGAPLFGPYVFLFAPRYDIPPPVTMILFFATLAPAFWPVINGRAPITFWVVAIVLWMAGGVVGIAL